MKKARVVGIIMIVIAVVLYFAFKNDATDMRVGFFAGGGLGILIAGRFGTKRTNLSRNNLLRFFVIH